MEHVKTIFHQAASTPNGLLATGDGGVYVTNDHDSKTGEVCVHHIPHPTFYPPIILTKTQIQKQNQTPNQPPQFRFLEMIFGGGSVAYRTLENATSPHLPDSNSPEYIGYFGSEKGMQVSDPTSCVW